MKNVMLGGVKFGTYSEPYDKAKIEYDENVREVEQLREKVGFLRIFHHQMT